MEKSTATRLIEQTFDQPFDEQRFKHFVRNLFNRMDESKAQTWQGAYVPEAFRDQIKLYKRLGTYTDPYGTALDILVVYLKKETGLERARTMQRNFVARHLKTRGEKEAAVVAYTGEDPADWRFSLVKMEYQARQDAGTGKIKIAEELTPARRYSFLVGQYEPNHTAQQYLLPVLQDDRHNPTLAELEAAFNIESVTREFFEQYKELFWQLKESLEQLITASKQVKAEFERRQLDPANFAKKLLGQIVFLYFLQKKGWLGVEPSNPWGSGPRNFLRRLFEQRDVSYHNFFNDLLEPLFYAALALPRSGDLYPQLKRKIPFLNGGLFEPMGDYDWQGLDILLPNSLFSNNHKTKRGDVGTGILDVFDRYNFTIAEDEPLEKEVAVDPEMLGKVFENLLEVTDRKSKGAFYTPREIVHYMCQESLINYLDTAINTHATTPLLPPQPVQKKLFGPDDPQQLSLESKAFGTEESKAQLWLALVPRADLDTFIRRGELALENETTTAAKPVETGTYYYQLPESIRRYASQLDTALADIKICDPAIGSGAFPVGMMQEIVKARQVLTPYLTRINGSPNPDLEKGSPNLGLETGSPNLGLETERPNPVLDLEIEPDKVRDAPATYLSATTRQPKQALDSSGRSPKLALALEQTRTAYHFKRHAIQESIYGVDIDPAAVDIAKLRLWLSLVVDEEDYQRIKPLPNLDYKIVCGNSLLSVTKDLFNRDLFEQLERLQDEHFAETDLHQKRLRMAQVEALIQQLTNGAKEFDFQVYFGKVFRSKGGFDVVIGNPPYVRQEQLKALKPALQKQYTTYSGVADLYIYFYERGFQILREGGTLTFISSNKYFRSGYGQKLRYYLASRATVRQLIDFGDAPVFEAIAYPSIILLSKTPPGDNHIHALTWQPGPPITEFPTVFQANSFLLSQKALTADGWRLESPQVLALLERLRQAGQPLGEYVQGRFYRGILTGLNEAFVVDRITRDRLIAEHPSSAEVLKPFLRGRDVKRWRVEPQDLWLIFTRRGIDIKKYPAIHKHLRQYKKELTPGGPGGRKPGSYQWYEIQDNIAYWQKFEQPKIIVPAITQNVEYASDFSGYYTNDKTSICVSDDVNYLLGLLNSKTLWWFIQQIAAARQGGFYEFKPMYVTQLPIPTPTSTQRAAIELVVTYLLFLMEQPFARSSDLSHASDRLMLKYFEQLLNGLVYELYFPEELHQAEKQFIQPFLAEKLPALDQIKGDKLAGLRAIFERLYDKDHPIRRNLFFLDSLEIVRIIEGKERG